MKHEHGYIKDGKVFRHKFLQYEEIQIGIVKTTEEEAIQYFTKKYDILYEKINTLEKKIEETVNKGSYFMKLIHIKESITKYKGLGNFTVLYQKLESIEKYLRELIYVNKEKNKEGKEALIQELSILIDQESDIKHIQEHLKNIRERWIKKGDTFAEMNTEYDKRFLSLIRIYYAKKKEYYTKLGKTFYENKKKHKKIIEQIRNIQKNGKNKETIEQVKILQKEWKTIGKVPIKDKQYLQKELQKVTEFFFVKEKPPLQKNIINKPHSINTNKKVFSSNPNRFDTEDNADRFEKKEVYFISKKTISFPKLKEPLDESIKKKQMLLSKLEVILNTNDTIDIQNINNITDEWKKIGEGPKESAFHLSEKFFFLIGRIEEKNNKT